MSTTTEIAPKGCPFCGAGDDGVSFAVRYPRFLCRTLIDVEQPTSRLWQSPACATAERDRLTRERDEAKRKRDDQTKEIYAYVQSIHELKAEREHLLTRVTQLEEAGEFLDDVLDAADDDIREHLQVANYNLHGLLNTGERIQPPNPPQIIHQAGIDASVKVREDLRKARNEWRKAKEATP